MKQMLVTVLLSICLSAASPSCSKGDEPVVKPPAGQSGNTENPDDDNKNDAQMNEKITIKAGNTSFTATLQDNVTAKAFLTMLPLTVTMNEHAGNEKYHNLPAPLPANASRPGIVRTGDLMLWGDDCLVLFYETFSSSYSYTRIGKIDNPSGLQTAVGNGNVTVTFEILQQGSGTQTE